MEHVCTADEILAGHWQIQDMVGIVRSLIDEVERLVLQKELLPQTLVQGLYETIDSIEAEIIRRRAALPLATNQIDKLGTGYAHSQAESELQVHIPPVSFVQREDDLRAYLATEQGPTDLQALCKDSQPSVADRHGILDSLQDNIKAVQSVILLRMNNSMSSKTHKTSSVVSFSILDEEMRILDGLLERVTRSYGSTSDDENGDVLEQKVVALPTQLSALFNMEIQEAAQEGSEIDEKAMVQMVVENQKRTSVLRHIEIIANKVWGVTRHTQ